MARSEETSKQARRFAEEAGRRRATALGEIVRFLSQNKKWWLAPIVVILLVIGLLVILGGTAAAPFIYPFF